MTRFLVPSPPIMRGPAALIFIAFLGCTRAEPPSWDASTGSLAVAPLPPPSGYAGQANSVAPSGAGNDAAPPEDDPGTLPQTRERPDPASPRFQARIDALFRGIVADDPQIALPAFFPPTAYAQVKAVANPKVDWERRLVAAFKRDLHAIHQRLGTKKLSFVRLDIPAHAVRWVEPDEEMNRIGYFRVYGSRLVLDAGGHQETVEIKSLISWRGEWYVVHLSGFK